MQSKVQVRWLLLVSVVVFVVVGCFESPTLPPASDGGGFIIQTEFEDANSQRIVAAPVTRVRGAWKSDLSGTTGSASPFDVSTNGLGLYASINGRAPAVWNLTWVESFTIDPGCNGLSGDFPTMLHQVTTFRCIRLLFNNFASDGGASISSFSPNPLYWDNSAGSTGTIQGQGFKAQYGMPLLQYYDLQGNLKYQAFANNVASDGTWPTSSLPNMSQFQQGTYVGFVYNANANGGYDYVATSAVQVLSSTLVVEGGPQRYDECSWDGLECVWYTVYDAAWLTVTVNGFSATAYSDSWSTSDSMASSLASQLNNPSSPVTATVAESGIRLATKACGTSVRYDITTSRGTFDPYHFGEGSFSIVGASTISGSPCP